MSDMKTYEGMFLLDAGKGDFNAVKGPVETILSRAKAEVLSLKAWDERRLAFAIKGRKRALYVLSYFKADPASVAEMERDCQLSDDILRSLILRRETLTEKELNAATPAEAYRPGEDREAGEDHGGRHPRRERVEVSAGSTDKDTSKESAEDSVEESVEEPSDDAGDGSDDEGDEGDKVR